MSARSVVARRILGATACAGLAAGAFASAVHPARSHPGPPPGPPDAEHGSPWPVASHDVGHSGRSAHAGPTTGMLRWVRRLDGDVTPGPVVGADGTIYLATNAGTLHALDPRTGQDRWVVRSGGTTTTDLSSSPAVLDSGVVVWATPSGAVRGIAPDGRQLWSIDLSAAGTSPAPIGDRLYVMSVDGSLTAIGLTDGGRSAAVAWTMDLGTTSYSSPAVSPDGLVAVNVDDQAVGVRDQGRHGSVAWRFTLGALSEISPAIGPGGSVVTGANDRWIVHLTPEGRLIARYDRELESYSSPVVTGEEVVQGNHHAAVVAFDLRAGVRRLRVQRRVDRPGRGVGVWTAPVLDRDARIYVGTQSGQIVGWTWTGHRLFAIDAGAATIDSYPALTADGALIVGDTDGIVRAVADDGTLPGSTRPPP